MGFFLQLKLLVWKNYTLRKRQKVRCLVELIWPLFLFAILMWVRSRGLKEFVNECHFQHKAMPSAGQLPFLQSFFCSFNNTCHSRIKDTEDGENVYNTSTILSQLENDMEALFKNDSLIEKWKKVQSINKDIQELSSLVQNVTNRQQDLTGLLSLGSFVPKPEFLKEYVKNENIKLDDNVVDSIYNSKVAIQNISLAQILMLRGDPKSVLCDKPFMMHFLVTKKPEELGIILDTLCNMPASNITNILLQVRKEVKYEGIRDEMFSYVEGNLGRSLDWDQWRELNRLTRELAQEMQALESYQDILKSALTAGTNYRTIISALEQQNISAVYSNFILAQHFICGDKAGDIISQIADRGGVTQNSQFDSLKDKLKVFNKRVHDYENDTDATPECNEMFKKLEQNSATRFLWLQIKPFFRGKILFSPKSVPAILRIMDRVNESFDSVSKIKDTSTFWVNFTLPLAKEQFVNNTGNIQLIREFVNSDIGRRVLTSSVNNDLVNNFYQKNNTAERVDYVLNMADSLLTESNSEGRASAFEAFESAQINISQLLSCFDVNKTEGYDNEEEAMKRGMQLLAKNKFWALISFLDIDKSVDNITGNITEKLQPFISYKIRMDSERVDDTRQVQDRIWHPDPRRRPAIDLKYITFGFAYLQDIIEHNIILEQTGRNRTPGIFLQQYPYPCHIVDRFVLAISRTFPMFMTLSWVYSCSMIVKSIVYEKERRLKETMRVMGLGNGVHWVGWFIDSIVPMIITITFLTGILVYGKVLGNSDPSIVFIFLLLYCITTITKSFLLSTLFSRANLAAAAGGIIFFIMYLPYPFMVIWESRISTNPKVIASLLSNVAFGFGCSYFAYYEEMGIGMHWHNMAQSPKLGDGYNLQYVMVMLVIDAVIYCLLTWYIETVFPGQYGVPKPWYFLFIPSYWRPSLKSPVTLKGNDNQTYDGHASRNSFEAEPEHLTLGVSIRDLCKVYGNGKVALKDLNMNFYEDQITSFLGHNGAGKTTTISILTGMFPPTSGTATIYNMDIRKDMDRIRSSLGMCPQHNVLFDHLSVEEHLWFYARLKNHPVAEVLSEIEKMLTDLGLPQKRHSLARTLSGGMQRKLSIAAAFIGGSKTVILDEPTSGVDPFSRRSIWELLIKYKQGRTVILTTHFMDEADLLGDRIAIIANGRLQCCGSSLFLKAKFGLGYYLTVETIESVPNRDSLNRVRVQDVVSVNETSVATSPTQSRYIEGITGLVKTHVPQAKLVQHLGTEIVYNLPDRDHKDLFEVLFDSLDAKMAGLGIISYGISDTTLEEIFLKVAEQGDEEHENNVPVANGHAIPLEDLPLPPGKGIESKDDILDVCRKCLPWSIFKKRCHDCNTGSDYKMKILDDNVSTKKHIVVQMQGCNVTYSKVPTLGGNTRNPKPIKEPKKPWSVKWEQFMALQIKRFHHTKRNPKAMFCELVVPALFVCMSLAFTVIFPKMLIAPPLVLEPAVYQPPNKVFFSNNANGTGASNWSLLYQHHLLGKIGMSTQCVEVHGKRGDYCKPVNIGSLAYSGEINMTSPECSCSKGTPECMEGAGGPEPPSAKGSTGDIMANMTGRNISDWIVKTTPTSYIDKGYGGFSFGMPNPLGQFNISRLLKLLQLANNLTGIGNMAELVLTPEMRQAAKEINLNSLPNEDERLDNIKVWFNNKGWVSSVAYMNAINNVILRASLPSDKQSKSHLYGIQLINHPMNFTKGQINDELVQQSGVSLLHAISVIFALSFVPASFVVFLIEERVSNAKHQQFVSGANRLIYWIAALCWDMTSYMFSAMLCILVFLAFNEQAYVSEDNIVGLILLLLLYGWSSVPLMYPASFLFSIPSSAFVALACANLFIGIVTTVATFVLEIFDDAELQYIASILKEVFLVFPQFCLGQGLMNMATRHLASKALSSYGVDFEGSVFDWNFLGKNMLCMLIGGAIFFSLNLMIEFKVFKICKHRSKPKLLPPVDEEEDVAAERLRVTSGEAEHDILLIKNLTKVYGRNRPAVDQMCLGVKRGECFGLLGLNGAGKTSTFKMLTGDTEPSSGDAFVTGFSVRSNMDNVRHHLGYCPQFDALDALLTPREHLQLYCRLRGIPSALRHEAVNNGLKRLGLGFYADRCAGTLSGGNKRKLSTAIALVGDPPLVFLDEPTSGMDPKARRFLWSCILDVVEQGRSVVLTSHSMEECEALCTKLTIMVNGKFTCFGSSQHLKSKFGRGYSLQVRCKENLLSSVVDYVKLHLPSSMLRETHYNQLKFQLPQVAFKLADVFRVMEKARRNELVQDYSISQTTLEEVFLRFAKEQTSETNDGLDESHGHLDV